MLRVQKHRDRVCLKRTATHRVGHTIEKKKVQPARVVGSLMFNGGSGSEKKIDRTKKKKKTFATGKSSANGNETRSTSGGPSRRSAGELWLLWEHVTILQCTDDDTVPELAIVYRQSSACRRIDPIVKQMTPPN